MDVLAHYMETDCDAGRIRQVVDAAAAAAVDVRVQWKPRYYEQWWAISRKNAIVFELNR